jgi:hypothetical protein
MCDQINKARFRICTLQKQIVGAWYFNVGAQYCFDGACFKNISFPIPYKHKTHSKQFTQKGFMCFDKVVPPGRVLSIYTLN